MTQTKNTRYRIIEIILLLSSFIVERHQNVVSYFDNNIWNMAEHKDNSLVNEITPVYYT